MDEVSRSNNDMTNLLNSTDIATLFLDGELRVRAMLEYLAVKKNASSTGGKRVGSFSARNLSACLSCPRCAPWRFPQASLSPSQALTNQEAGLTCSFALLFVSTVQ